MPHTVPTSRRPTAVVLLLLPLLTTAAGCGRRAAVVPPVVPVPATGRPTRSTTPSSAVPSSTVAGDRTSTTLRLPEATDDGRGRAAALRARVDEVLLRYDRALTALSAAPGAAEVADSKERRALDATVSPGATLAATMADEVVRRAEEEAQVVVPPTGGLSYRHRALQVERTGPDSVEFTWCGHSPGIGLDRTDGTVLDDAVAHSHGVGQVRAGPGPWTLDRLDQIELRILPPGAPDPCPSEVR